jgi:DNA-binding transcriptional regulator LsrR (DeoR family)
VNGAVGALTRLASCTIVQLSGVYSRMDVRDDSVETVRRAAAVSGGPFFPIYAPLVLPDRATAETLRRQPGIRDAFDHFDRITTAVVGIGAWQPAESTVYDVLEPAERRAAGELGIAAEVAGTLFDADGRTPTTGLTHHVLAMDADRLRGVPEVIALAAGCAKAGAIDAVLRSGLVTTLVTDGATACRLLELTTRRPPAHRAVDRLDPAAGR